MRQQEGSINICEQYDTSLHNVRNPLLQCAYCGWENDTRRYEFACEGEARDECEWCGERMCRHQGGAVTG